MKAICLLLCLALAQGHIFKRNHPKLDSYNVHRLEDSQAQREQYRVPEATASRINDHMRPVSWASIEHTKGSSEVSSTEARKQITERQQQQQTPQIQTETQQQYYRGPQPLTKTVMDSYVNNGPYNYAMQFTKERPWEQAVYLTSYEALPAAEMHWRGNKQEREQAQELRTPANHDSTSAENSWETREITENAIPNYETIRDRMYLVQSEEQPARSWSSIHVAIHPKVQKDIYMREEMENILAEAQKTIKPVSQERKEYFHQLLDQTADKVNEDTELNATQLLNKHHYEVETHTVKTDDGYILTLFRILPRVLGSEKRPVAFLMHGLLGSADDWLLMGPNKSLAYMLADNGHEVWLGNARGNKYSRRHVSKHPALADFWQFGNDEIALHDLPAMIDYALKTSGQSQLHYVGYSQGTTAFFALVAARPEFNKKISRMSALSPMVYMSETRSPMLRMIAPTSSFYEILHKELGHGEFKASKEYARMVGSMCEDKIGCKHVCSNVNFLIAGVNVENVDVEMIPVIMAHLPAGGSTRQMKQYGQAVISHDFTRYNYGSRINKEVYGRIQPPKYDMSKVEIPVTLYYSEEDWLAHPKDVERLANELPHAQTVNVGANFSNMDFLVSKDVPQVVYAKLIDSIKQNSENIYV